jgi:hypothetical protein
MIFLNVYKINLLKIKKICKPQNFSNQVKNKSYKNHNKSK